MAFYVNNEQLDELKISGRYKPGTLVYNSLKIYNNSSIKLNFRDLFVLPLDSTLKNPDIVKMLKITIDWGDGEHTTLAPHITGAQSSITTSTTDWTLAEHNYALNEKKSDLTIFICAYNSVNNCLRITIPIKIQYKSILEDNITFKLISANITNNNNVSYVLTDIISRVTITTQGILATKYDKIVVGDNSYLSDITPTLPEMP